MHRSSESGDRIFLLQLLRDRIGCHVYPVHRLDRAVSGAVLFARHAAAAATLGESLRAGRFAKTYLAAVHGAPPPAGRIALPLTDRETGRPAACVTDLLPLAAAPGAGLVLLSPVTGRRHQLRRHMKKVGRPILGDTGYGRGEINRAWRDGIGLPRLALHALRLVFPHPRDGSPVAVHAPPPPDLAGPLSRLAPFAAALERLEAVAAAWSGRENGRED